MSSLVCAAPFSVSFIIVVCRQIQFLAKSYQVGHICFFLSKPHNQIEYNCGDLDTYCDIIGNVIGKSDWQ
jgi:hypothetical protein